MMYKNGRYWLRTEFQTKSFDILTYFIYKK